MFWGGDRGNFFCEMRKGLTASETYKGKRSAKEVRSIIKPWRKGMTPGKEKHGNKDFSSAAREMEKKKRLLRKSREKGDKKKRNLEGYTPKSADDRRRSQVKKKSGILEKRGAP